MSRDIRLRKGKKQCVDGLGRFGAPVPAEEAKAAYSFWSGLDVDEKLRRLRFEDFALVSEVLGVQKELCLADVQCYMLGVRGQDSSKQRIGIDEFAMECSEDGQTPIAFYAKPVFVERDDLIGHLERRLGSPFLTGRLACKPSEWRYLLEPRAKSWSDFMSQILKLVELAILQAHYDAVVGVSTSDYHKEAAEESPDVSTKDSECAGLSKCAKRKARKKQNNVSIREAASVDDSASSNLSPEQSENSLANRSTTAPGSAREPVSLEFESEALASIGEVEGTVDEQSILGAALPTLDESSLKCDWSAAGQPIDSVGDSAVELEVDWSADGPRSTETRWSAWMPNGLSGVAAEWAWADQHQVAKAYIKNTFVDVVEVEPTEQYRHPRSRSLPATWRRNATVARKLLSQKQCL